MNINPSDRFVAGEVLVKTRSTPFKSAGSVAEDLGAEVVDTFKSSSLFKSGGEEVLHLRLPEGVSTEEALARLADDPRVEVACPNSVYRLAGRPPLRPNDLNSGLWGLDNQGQDGGTPDADIDAPEAWKVTTGSRENGPIIAVLDTGQDYDHPDLVNNLWTNPGEIPGDGIDNDGNGVIDDVHGYNAVLDNGDARHGHGHGTHCAGTIAAEGNNSEGVVGLNWEAQVMPIKIFPDDGDATTAATILRAVEYADKMGARITSNSWTGAGYNPLVKEAFEGSPALHIFAAGNDSRDNDFTSDYPANFDIDNMVVVAASDRNDKLGFFSSFGKKTVDLAAPGVGILSTVPGGGYEAWNGTSMATPHVAGVAGLIATAYPEASNREIKDRLLYGTEPKPDLAGKMVTGGRLNAARSLSKDALAPAAPTDFSARAGFDKVRVSWSETGDDGFCGQASAYEVRASSSPLTAENFEEAPVVAWERAGDPGAVEMPSFDVMPSSTPRTMHVGLQVIDKVGNRSELVTREVTVRPGRIAFEDDFGSEETSWTADPAWSRADGSWTVVGSEGGAEAALVSAPFDLAEYGDSTLYLQARYNLEPHYEFVKVEVAEVGSDRWRRLDEFNGNSHGTVVHKLPMHDFDQKQVRVRFVFEGDGPGRAEGFSLEKVAVTGYTIGEQKPFA